MTKRPKATEDGTSSEATPMAGPVEFDVSLARQRVVFGEGSLARLPQELARIGASRVLVIANRSCQPWVQELAQGAAGLIAGTIEARGPQVPIDQVQTARLAARRLRVDCCLAIGGGSALGLAKAVVLSEGFRSLAAPATYCGAELSARWEIISHGSKKIGIDPRVLPRTVIYDPSLSAAIAPAAVAAGCMVALGNCLEAGIAGSAAARATASRAATAIVEHLPALLERPGDQMRRRELMRAGYLAAFAASQLGEGLLQRICDTICPPLGLPHARVAAIMLPHVAAYWAARAGSAQDAAELLDLARVAHELADRAPLTMALSGLGVAEGELFEAAATLQSGGRGVSPIRPAALRSLLQRAYHGWLPPTVVAMEPAESACADRPITF